jgi:hypothetical protein
MRAAAKMLRFTVLVAGVLTFGCNSDPAAPEQEPIEDQQEAGLLMPDGGQGADGTQVCTATWCLADSNFPAYPPGPYGYTVGSTLEDFEFMGLLNPKAVNYEASATTLTKIAMRDFYNPTKDSSRPRALLVTESALWCSVCQAQAEAAPTERAYWRPLGVEFLELVFEDENHDRSENQDLATWTSSFELDFPSALDPYLQLGRFFNKSAAPFNMVIDLATMTITYTQEGFLDCGPDNPEFLAIVGQK